MYRPPLHPPLVTAASGHRAHQPRCAAVFTLHHRSAGAERPGITRPWMREDGRVARSGSDKRQRQMSLSARFNQQEAQAVREAAELAGLPVASLIRERVLGAPAPRARRRPTVNHQVAARVLFELARIAQVLREAQECGALSPSDPRVAAALRDLAELRALCFEALGRQP